jgi:ribonuclease BN (tRNA processing enzyme)
VKIRYWGTRGSLATPGQETIRYGGNTSCVEVESDDGHLLVLDAGTGIRPLGDALVRGRKRLDVLLTHLHMDHIQGLGFFDPLFWPELEVHLWGPSSTTQSLHTRLTRYLSPPLFPVRIAELGCNLTLHDVVAEPRFEIGPFQVEADLVCHPGPTVGYRVSADATTVTYIPDHEPFLGEPRLGIPPAWIPGLGLARDADLLIHDAQFSHDEYPRYVGWGHSSIDQTVAFAKAAGVRQLAPFHHDPSHSDGILDRLFEAVHASQTLPFTLTPAAEGALLELVPRDRDQDQDQRMTS